MYYNIILRQDTLDNWNANSNVILGKGEIALVSTNNNRVYDAYKVGDGQSPFSDLELFYLIKTDEYHNPVIVNPSDGNPIDVPHIVDVTTLKDLHLYTPIIDSLNSFNSSVSGSFTISVARLFEQDNIILEVGRSYLLPNDGGWFGKIIRTGDTSYKINLFKTDNLTCTYRTDIEVTLVNNSWSLQVVQLIHPFIYLWEYYQGFDYNREYGIIEGLLNQGKPFLFAFEGKIYSHFRLDSGHIYLTSVGEVTDYYGDICYLSINTIDISNNPIGDDQNPFIILRDLKYMRLSSDIITDIWVVNLPDNWASIEEGAQVSVESVWGSRANFQDWLHHLDPMNVGISLWDVLLHPYPSRRGTMSKQIIDIEGHTIVQYYISLIHERDDGVWLDRYKLYNNPLNNTVPIMDMVEFTDSYNITNLELNQILSDWNENDPNNKAYILNRTHWIEFPSNPEEDPIYHKLDQKFIPELTDQYLTSSEETDVINNIIGIVP